MQITSYTKVVLSWLAFNLISCAPAYRDLGHNAGPDNTSPSRNSSPFALDNRPPPAQEQQPFVNERANPPPQESSTPPSSAQPQQPQEPQQAQQPQQPQQAQQAPQPAPPAPRTEQTPPARPAEPRPIQASPPPPARLPVASRPQTPPPPTPPLPRNQTKFVEPEPQKPAQFARLEPAHQPEPVRPADPVPIAVQPAPAEPPRPQTDLDVEPQQVASLPAPSAPADRVVPVTKYNPFPALWESQHRDGVMWTAYLTQLISTDLEAKLLPGSNDMRSFCPRYYSLNADQRINFWTYLISTIAKYESSFNPTDRFQERGQGIDKVTGRPVYSEGLLQLSYQDRIGRPYCEFDWNYDRRLPARSPQKTILDPLKNLKCGAHILANQIKNSGRIAWSGRGVYWAVLVPGGRYSKVGQIQRLTRRIPFC